MLFGHLAVSALQHRYLEADLAPVVAAGIFPDVVDKTLRQVLRLMPSGRMFGHTLMGLGLSTVVVGLIWGRRTAWGWALGYLGHLLGDSGEFVPWLYPFAQYDFSKHSPGLLEILWRELRNPAAMGLELTLSAWAVYALCWPRVKIVSAPKWWDSKSGAQTTQNGPIGVSSGQQFRVRAKHRGGTHEPRGPDGIPS